MRLSSFCGALLPALLAAVHPALGEPMCRGVLPDGRVVLARPLFTAGGIACPSLTDIARMTQHRPEPATLPSMRFTTGEIGPFTTGEIGPFTTGEIGPFTTGHIGPLTTFSNSPPSMAAHR